MTEVSPELKQALGELMQLATQRHQAGDLANAERLYGKVLEFMPMHAPALHNLGLIYLHKGDSAAAELLLSEAVKQGPGEATFHYNLAFFLQQQDRLEESALSYAVAVKLRPAYRLAWENWGVVLQDLERFEEAEQAYRQALDLDPHSSVAYRNLGNVLRVLGRMDEAVEHYKLANEKTPLDGEVAFGYGATLLSIGDFAEGWRWYEWRHWSSEFLEGSPPFRIALPKWDGSDLSGKNLLIYGEQGIGDMIMFASCLDDAAKHAQSVTLLCEQRLVPLFARSFPNMIFVAEGAAGSSPVLDETCQFDCCISLASLPRFFRNSISSFPGQFYLAADEARRLAWLDRLEQLGKPLRIGLSWRGGRAARARVARSAELQVLAQLFARQDIAFVNVQYGCHDDEIAAFNGGSANPLVCFPEVDPLRDMDEFAAMLSALDLVISVDNSTVHLAGALGVPTWVMHPYGDWRWQRGHEDTLWYPTVRLFWPQTQGKDIWPGIVGQIAGALEQAVPRVLWHEVPAEGGPGIEMRAELGDPARPLALLINDTSHWGHWGNSASSLALHEGLRDAGYRVDSVAASAIHALIPVPGSLEEFDDADFYESFCSANRPLVERMAASELVFINGEGLFHGLGHPAVALMYVAYVAKRWLNKSTQIVNLSCSSRDPGVASGELADSICAKLFGVLDFVAVCEDASLKELARIDVAARRSFDSLPLFVRRHPPMAGTRAKRVLMAGSENATPEFLDAMCQLALAAVGRGYQVQLLVGANACPLAEDVLLESALRQRLKGRYTLLDTHSESDWLKAIASAALLVSGQIPHTIAAAILDTPVLVVSSNMAEAQGLLERLQLSVDDVWLDTAEPQQSLNKLARVLHDPSCAMVASETKEHLYSLAACNFDGVKLHDPGL